jgi:hypothetical protein
MPIGVRIHQEDDFSVPQLLQVQRLPDAAADGNMRSAAMPLVGLLMDAVPELQADLQAVRN